MTDKELLARGRECGADATDVLEARGVVPLSPEERQALNELSRFLSRFTSNSLAREATDAERERLIAIFGDSPENGDTWADRAGRSGASYARPDTRPSGFDDAFRRRGLVA